MRSGTIAFLLGGCGLVQLPSLPHWWVCLAFPGVLWVTFYIRGCHFPGLVVIGYLWALLRGHFTALNYLPTALEGRDLVLEGYVVSIPVVRSNSTQFVFVVYSSPSQTWSARVRLNWYYPPFEITPGQRLRLTVRLKRPAGFMNPGGFDYEGWLFHQRIGATGYVRLYEQSLLPDSGSTQLLTQFRAKIHDFIGAVLREHAQLGPVTALAIGYRHAITPRQWTVLRTTGTSHLMAISGLQIGLVAGASYFSVLWLWSRIPSLCLAFAAPRAGAVAGVGAAVVYAALADFSIPTQRALIMTALVMLSLILRR